MITKTEDRINELFELLVPMSGPAGTVAGEIIRAIARLGYRNYNDGDHIGVGYGKETCNPAARYLSTVCDERVSQAIDDAWGIYSDDTYEVALAAVEEAVITFLDEHPELQETENKDNMLSYATEDDVDDSWDDDDDEWW
jgi:hypothetical protein